jgi:hypothetical protein
MATRLYFLAILTGLAFAGCKTRQSGSAAKSETDTPPELTCDGGEAPVFFGLKAQEDLPDIKTLGIPPSVYTADRPNMYDNEIGPNKTLRLDICFNESEGVARLVRVVSKARRYGTYEVGETSKIAGLESLIFENSFKDLEIAIEIGPGEYKPGSTRGIFIKGTEKTSYSFYGEHLDGKWEPYINDIQAGTWEMGDPFANAVCTAGEAFGKSKFTLGTAAFQIEYCHDAISTGTTSYRIIRLALNDSEPTLAESDREIIIEGEQEIKKVLQQKITHHNLCDSLHLKLPNREYWATSAAFQIGNTSQCQASNILPDAPVPPENEFFEHMMFKVSYNKGPVKNGESTNCRSFIFQCQ